MWAAEAQPDSRCGPEDQLRTERSATGSWPGARTSLAHGSRRSSCPSRSRNWSDHPSRRRGRGASPPRPRSARQDAQNPWREILSILSTLSIFATRLDHVTRESVLVLSRLARQLGELASDEELRCLDSACAVWGHLAHEAVARGGVLRQLDDATGARIGGD